MVFFIDWVWRRAKRIRAKLGTPPPRPTNLALRCREITSSDLEGITDLLTAGFWRSPRTYWTDCIKRLSGHQTPDGYPKYGYMLENAGTPVGVLLMIFTERRFNGTTVIWCNESSYYVEPHFRYAASLLVKRAHRFKEVTYLDLTASPHRWTTLAAQGYQRLAKGLYVGLPMLCRPPPGVHVREVTSYPDTNFEPFENDLLVDHANYGGCISVICDDHGVMHPFVFALRRRYGVPFAYLLYSREQSDFIWFAGTLGRFLAKRGILIVALDADGPISGIPGRLTDLYPKFWSGPMQPQLGDLAYTEMALFGVL